MKKRFSTVVMSCLLLPVFLGSAEAKIIDNYGAGAGSVHFAAAPAALFEEEMAKSGWPLGVGGPGAGIDRLLAFYFGIAAGSHEIDPQNESLNARGDALPSGEENEDFSLASYSIAGPGYAGQLSGQAIVDPALVDPALVDPTIAADQQNTSAPAAAGKIPPPKPQPTTPLPYSFSDPPTIVITSGPVKPPASPAPKKPPKATPTASNPPTPPIVADHSSSGAGNPAIQSPEKDKSKDSPQKSPKIQPNSSAVSVDNDKDYQKKKSNHGQNKQDLLDEKNVAAYGWDVNHPALIATEVRTPKAGRVDAPENGSGDYNIVHNKTADAPAPVPEPTTMLLFTTGIAGFAFNRLRRNRNSVS